LWALRTRCSTFSYFSSPFTDPFKDALSSGNCTLINKRRSKPRKTWTIDNKARGVTYVDRATRQVKEVRGKAVILCAPRIGIHSDPVPNSRRGNIQMELAHSSARLGRYLMDHVVGREPRGSARVQSSSQCKRAPAAQRDFTILASEHSFEHKHFAVLAWLWFQGGAGADSTLARKGTERRSKNAVKEAFTGFPLGLSGEFAGAADNYCEIDRDLKDAWGNSRIAHFHDHGDNEAALMEDAGATAAEMLEAAGAKDIRVQAKGRNAGMAIHEWGQRARGDPKKSVLNAFQPSARR